MGCNLKLCAIARRPKRLGDLWHNRQPDVCIEGVTWRKSGNFADTTRNETLSGSEGLGFWQMKLARATRARPRRRMDRYGRSPGRITGPIASQQHTFCMLLDAAPAVPRKRPGQLRNIGHEPRNRGA